MHPLLLQMLPDQEAGNSQANTKETTMQSSTRRGALALLGAGMMSVTNLAKAALPVHVDRTPQQSPVQDQGGRDTCGTFATIGAIEAAYRRDYGVMLNLSEQFLNHWAQQFDLTFGGRALPGNETNAGSVGGGGLTRPIAALSRGLGVPLETDLAYIPDVGYQNIDAGDSPSLNDWSKTYPQRMINDFNLADEPAWYIHTPPNWAWQNVMPQGAINAARFRPTGVTMLTPAQVKDVDMYRTILAGGREVMVEFNAHVVLIVGYDDSMQRFKYKNSYGPGWGESGYGYATYDVITNSAQVAAYIHGVVSPSGTFDPFSHKHFFLGRWRLNFDGWKGMLDIYNMPEPFVAPPWLTRNYRVGTLFMDDGRIHRVNGILSANQLTFYVDWSNPNLPPSQLSGARFTTWMFTRDHRAMAGHVTDGINTFAVSAVKGPLPISGVARPGGLSVMSYIGTWDFDHDGWKGRIDIPSANLATRQLMGRYVNSSGRAFGLVGYVKSDARLFSLEIAFDMPQRFEGYLNGHQLGVMAGTTTWGGMRFGFFGKRRP